MKVLKSGDVVMFEDKSFNIHMTTETAKEVLEGLKKVLDVTATTDSEELSKSKRKIVDIGKGITFHVTPGSFNCRKILGIEEKDNE